MSKSFSKQLRVEKVPKKKKKKNSSFGGFTDREYT